MFAQSAKAVEINNYGELKTAIEKVSGLEIWKEKKDEFQQQKLDLSEEKDNSGSTFTKISENPIKKTLKDFWEEYIDLPDDLPETYESDIIIKYIYVQKSTKDPSKNSVLLATPAVAELVTIEGKEWQDVRPDNVYNVTFGTPGTSLYYIYYYDEKAKEVKSAMGSLSMETINMRIIISNAVSALNNLNIPDTEERTEAGKDWDKRWKTASDGYTEMMGKIAAAANYKELTIKEDIEVIDDALSGDTLPADYVIYGNNKHIINKSEKALLLINKGGIHDLISLDQSIASTNSGKAYNCIVCSSKDSKFRIYDAEGTAGQGFASLEDAIYSERGTYGMNFSAEPEGSETKEEAIKRSVGLKADDDSNKLYQAQYANATNKSVSSFKVNINADGLGYDSKLTVNRENAVVYIDDTDANTMLENVAVKNGDGDYVCANAKLTDGKNKQGFYVPYDFKATKLNYDRVFNKNYVAVCLPFKLEAAKIKGMGAFAYTFQQTTTNSKGENVMRLERIDDDINANTPCILVSENPTGAAEFTNLANVDIIAGGASSNKNLFGNYRADQTYSDLVNQAKAKGIKNPAIYGIQTSKETGITKFVKMVNSDNSHLYAFRSFVALEETENGARSFNISLLDEDGNEEVTGIMTVDTTNNNTDFKAVGGRNAIEITTGKACDVKVYTLNGALAKTARVEAGTTTLPMNAGMYVVNKTKVIVK